MALVQLSKIYLLCLFYFGIGLIQWWNYFLAKPMWKVFMKVSCSWMRVLCLSRQSALLVSALNLRPLLLPLRKNFFHPFSPLPRCESGYYQNNNINLVWWGWGGGGWVKKVRSWRRLMQGPKLTFYYGRQLAIKYKFLVARGQIVVAKKIPPPFFQIKV